MADLSYVLSLPAIFEWLSAEQWLILQYMPCNQAKHHGATLHALSPAGVEWRFHFNTRNELSGYACQNVYRGTGEIEAEVHRP